MKIYLFLFFFMYGCSIEYRDSDFTRIENLLNLNVEQGLIIFFNPDGCPDCVHRLNHLLSEDTFHEKLVLVMVSRNAKPYINKYSSLGDTVIVDATIQSIKMDLFTDLPVIYQLRNNTVKKVVLELDEDFLSQIKKHDIL